MKMKKLLLVLLAVVMILPLSFCFTASAVNDNGYVWPITGQYMSQGYKYYGNGGNTAHTGIDISAPYGTPIYAARGGEIRCASTATPGANDVCPTCSLSAGYHVIIKQDDGNFAVYAHMSAVSVVGGQYVKAGQKIGEVGSTGNSTGNHLHFSFHNQVNGWFTLSNSIDPMKYLTPFSSVSAENITETSARIWANLAAFGTPMTAGGFYIGKSADNMTKITDGEITSSLDYIGNGIEYLFFDTTKYYKTLEPGTKYYFRVWLKHNGTEYTSDLCSFTTKGSRSVSKLEIDTLPNKTEYYVGETLDTTGLKLKATYTDGTTKTITNGFTVSGFSSTETGTKKVTVSYGGIATSFEVKVIPKPNIELYVASGVLENKTVRPGELFEINLSVKTDNPGFMTELPVQSIGINVTHDSSKLELVSGEWLAANATIADWNSTNHTAALAFSSNSNIANQKIFKLTFKALSPMDDCETQISCSIVANQKVSNVETKSVPIYPANSTITITNVLKGDVDGNDVVNADDAIYLLYHTLFGEKDYPVNQNCNFDGLGNVSADDAIYLLYHTLFGAKDYPLK